MLGTMVSNDLAKWAIAHRRYLHEHPELSGQEFETSAYIKEILKELKIDILDYKAPSVVGFLKGTVQSKTIALRADIDALPIQEEGDKSYNSKNPGVAHMCGHDGHTAILLATAKWLSEHRDEIEFPNVKFIFQSSEEDLPSGAEILVKQGVMDDVNAVFGLHLMQALPKGKIGICHGAMNAAADDFTVTIKGKGGHGSSPHTAVDPTYVSGHFIIALQSIVGRRLDPTKPAVISIGKLEAGEAHNVIPEIVTIRGTIRTLTSETRHFICKEMEELVEKLCMSFGAEGNVEFGWGAPPVVNDDDMSHFAEQVVLDIFGEDNLQLLKPSMGGEDFSYYLEKQKGVYLHVGMGGEKSQYPHHHPKFDIDEDSIPTGIELFINLVQQFSKVNN